MGKEGQRDYVRASAFHIVYLYLIYLNISILPGFPFLNHKNIHFEAVL